MVEKLAQNTKWSERLSYNITTYTELFFYIFERGLIEYTRPYTSSVDKAMEEHEEFLDSRYDIVFEGHDVVFVKKEVPENVPGETKTGNLEIEEQVNEKPFKCTKCDYAAKRSYNLQAHMKTHSNERPFQCTKCEYAAKFPQHLRRHLTTHSNEGLKSHNRFEHTEREKTLECPECDYVGARPYHLTRHMKTHKGAKAYKCEICQFATTRSRYLMEHVNNNHPDNP